MAHLRVTRLAFALLLAAFFAVAPASSCAADPADLNIQLRSVTGSNRFQIGEVIPLELVVSSTTPGRYLEPCELFVILYFGYPQCRFFNPWSFEVLSPDGWIDLDKAFPEAGEFSGPTFDVPDHDLTSQPKAFPYTLTTRFRFEKPGLYTVRVTTQIALDDPAIQRNQPPSPAQQSHVINVIRDVTLDIVPADPAWQAAIIRDGKAAFRLPPPNRTDPPTPEYVHYVQATQALCTLQTPESALALATLLSEGRSVEDCFRRMSPADYPIAQMQRLLVDPTVAVTPDFFRALLTLLARTETGSNDLVATNATDIDAARNALFASLPGKLPAARLTSLATLLANPLRSAPQPGVSSYMVPFAAPIIAAAADNFDALPGDTQNLLLTSNWDTVRSPLMLPIVRRLTEAGDARAILRWLDLDPEGATAFIRAEILSPHPRFSSFLLRLPDASLPGQEQQIAANFTQITNDHDLAFTHTASLLHRYATRAVLPTVLPFIDASRAQWSCSMLVPVLAYLLKVSPQDAEPRIRQALANNTYNHGCYPQTLLTDVGTLQPSPVLAKIAVEQIRSVTSLARDAADYLRRHAPPSMKPVVWQLLKDWHAELKAAPALAPGTSIPLTDPGFAASLLEAYTAAQGWVLTPEDTLALQHLLGEDPVAGIACQFQCGSSIALSATDPTYTIYSRLSFEPWAHPREMDYLFSGERLRYSIKQYSCPDLAALEQKLLQFPAGSKFLFAYDFSPRDRTELIEIANFLLAHNDQVINALHWDFLPSSPPPIPIR